MESTYAARALFTCVSLLGCWLLWDVFFKAYRLDALRQRLFNLRGDLFDYAATGAISFNHPAYGMLRTRINRLIRFAHRFTSMQLLLVVTMSDPPSDHEPLLEWQRALETVDSEAVRRRLRTFNTEMFTILVWHMVTGSLILMASLAVFGVCWAVKQMADRAFSALGNVANDAFQSYVRRFPVEQLEVQAYEASEEHATAA
jgi:hypothetical protein